METPLCRHFDFKTALYQFLMPTVEMGPGEIRTRMEDPSHLSYVDGDILRALDGALQTVAKEVSSNDPGRRCKDVGAVTRVALSPPAQTNRRRKPSQKPQQAASSSSGRKTRTKKTKTGAQDDDEERVPKEKTKYFNELKRHRKDWFSLDDLLACFR